MGGVVPDTPQEPHVDSSVVGSSPQSIVHHRPEPEATQQEHSTSTHWICNSIIIIIIVKRNWYENKRTIYSVISHTVIVHSIIYIESAQCRNQEEWSSQNFSCVEWRQWE